MNTFCFRREGSIKKRMPKWICVELFAESPLFYWWQVNGSIREQIDGSIREQINGSICEKINGSIRKQINGSIRK